MSHEIVLGLLLKLGSMSGRRFQQTIGFSPYSLIYRTKLYG